MPLRKMVYNEIYSDCEGAQWLVTVFKLYDTLHILDPIPVPTKPSPAIMNMPADSFNLLENLKSLVIEGRNDPLSLGKVEGLMPFIMKKLTSLELLLELEQREQVGRLEAFIRSKGESVKHLRLDIGDVEIFQKQAGELTPVSMNAVQLVAHQIFFTASLHSSPHYFLLNSTSRRQHCSRLSQTPIPPSEPLFRRSTRLNFRPLGLRCLRPSSRSAFPPARYDRHDDGREPIHDRPQCRLGNV